MGPAVADRLRNPAVVADLQVANGFAMCLVMSFPAFCAGTCDPKAATVLFQVPPKGPSLKPSENHVTSWS